MAVAVCMCACGVQLHLDSAVQLRLRFRMQPCLPCRAPWPGASADEALNNCLSACWPPCATGMGTTPVNDDEQLDFCAGMPPPPPPPHGVLVLCCSRMSVYDAPVHAREAEWAPVRQFQTNARKSSPCRLAWRMVVDCTGWASSASCTCCPLRLTAQAGPAAPSAS